MTDRPPRDRTWAQLPGRPATQGQDLEPATGKPVHAGTGYRAGHREAQPHKDRTQGWPLESQATQGQDTELPLGNLVTQGQDTGPATRKPSHTGTGHRAGYWEAQAHKDRAQGQPTGGLATQRHRTGHAGTPRSLLQGQSRAGLGTQMLGGWPHSSYLHHLLPTSQPRETGGPAAGGAVLSLAASGTPCPAKAV